MNAVMSVSALIASIGGRLSISNFGLGASGAESGLAGSFSGADPPRAFLSL
jgi:hypothetical protein